ncbi:DUF4142 domain-containing protein [Amycolatopsis sp. NPDC023774]|uniref:DUF4142 domain-containing protein n=1 Tax=Amycolatopsis sp. NPDC023774 TaxID=3155015 RepID=UPI003406C9D2
MLAVPARAVADEQVSSQDTTFMVQNAQTDLAEISLGQIAVQRATSSDARNLAQETMADHQQALGKLQTLASQNGVALPDTPSAEQHSMAAAVTSESGSAFDVAYLRAQVTGHTTSISQAETELSSGRDAAVVAFARDYLPVAQKHLAHAQSALQAMGLAPSGVNTGSGGAAAAQDAPVGWYAAIAAGGLVLAAAAALTLLPSRRGQASQPR